MIRNFSWAVPGRLAGAALPGQGAPWPGAPQADPYLLSDLRELRDMGIRRLVSLTDDARGFGPPCREAGLRWTYFPIPEFGIPDSEPQFTGLIDSLTGELVRGEAVCVHCYAGVGRTGLVLCCLVGRYCRLDAGEAVRRVRRARAALETAEQELFVQRFLETAG